jgi:protein-S-isoprenylcysteine O-methyltransferase Ste14
MKKKLINFIIGFIDGALYGFIGPFSLLYIVPQFLLRITNIPAKEGFGIYGIEVAGIILMWSGAGLAIYCSILMFLFGKGTPLVTSAPKKIIDRNIYGIIRHPMMWSLIMVIVGEFLTYGNIILLLWLFAMTRILYLIVSNYEEPQLERRFGSKWQTYCKKVPPWIPRLKK